MNDNTTTDVSESLKSAPLEILQEIVRLAEARMQAQLTAAIAADQRAMTFLGFVLTLVAFMIGASLASITASVPSQEIAKIAAGGAVGLFIAGFLAFLATRPVKFEFAGNLPGSFLVDVKLGKSLQLSLAEQAGHYDKKIRENRIAMATSASLLMWASAVAGFTIFLCAILAVPVIWR